MVRDDGWVLRRLVLCGSGSSPVWPAWSIASDNVAVPRSPDVRGPVCLRSSAGWALIAAAVLISRRPNRGVLALVTAAAGLAWFAGEWDAPRVGASLLFTAGLVVAGLCPPLVVWVMLGYPSGRLASWVERAVVVAAVVAGVVGVGLAAVGVLRPVRGWVRSLRGEPAGDP